MMKIKFVEIKNFRKLQSVRVDFSEKTTLFVGANNSGKTSAMVALGHFLVDKKRFATNDFTLSNWSEINKVGINWESDTNPDYVPNIIEWENLLPSLDVWIDADKNEIHHIRHLVPTLDWAGGLVGVRLQYEPKDILSLYKEYRTAIKASKDIKQAANNTQKTYNLSLWPKDLRDFLEKKLKEQFTVKSYLLDPAKVAVPKNGIAVIQPLPAGSESLESDPFINLIKIDEIAAQRGLGDQQSHPDDDDTTANRSNKKLSEQMRSYYAKHLDPSEHPSAADLDALEAIELAQKSFDDRLSSSFSEAIEELSSLNYPGVTDPVMKITTKIRPTDGLKHSAAVQYEVSNTNPSSSLRLPEEYNGLGYQNLISMVFRLMSFRDGWMRTGKADAQSKQAKATTIQPLHLVLVEEPEAHLHAQVQQVFIRKAYDVLRKHKNLGDTKTLHTQMIVSTHSSHVAHETEFSCLRYFRRLPILETNTVPTTAVINLSEVFGSEDDTAKFVARYLKSTHCDLFFADAAIMVEGQAERMLIPHFIRKNFEKLNRCYVSILEVGGSHAHRLKSLIEHLGLLTLIVTDIDSSDAEGKAVPPEKNKDQETGNETLRTWHPVKTKLDDLLAIAPEQKIKEYKETPLFSIRIAYQIPVTIQQGGTSSEVCSTTFEDALILENIKYFSEIEDSGIFKKIKKAINEAENDLSKLSSGLFKLIRSANKGSFALDLLWLDKKSTPLDGLIAPKYITEGLQWLEQKLTEKQNKNAVPQEVGVTNEQ